MFPLQLTVNTVSSIHRIFISHMYNTDYLDVFQGYMHVAYVLRDATNFTEQTAKQF
jgi:hypothetical protein